MKGKIAVVGGGLGGLSAAVYARLAGCTVDLYEAHPVTGGKAGSLEMKGYRFDTGPSLLTMPFVLENIFSAAGETISDYLTLRQLEESCRYFYPDGSVISAHRDPDRFADSLENATTDKRSGLFRYLDYSKRIYDLTAELFLFNDFHEPDTFKNHADLNTLKNLRHIDMLRTVHGANKSFFSDPKTLQLFDRYATFNGSSPFKAPATLNIIPHVEYTMGTFIPLEGIRAIPDALTRLALKLGVKIYTSTKVESVNHERGKIRGISVAGDDRDYDAVISNVDVTVFYRDLLNDAKTRDAKRYNRLEPSSSALVFLWGIKGTHDNLSTHNIIFSEKYTEEFRDLFDRKKCPADPTVYIYSSSKFNNNDAPSGRENWFVMINAPYDTGQDWNAEAARSRQAILSRIGKAYGTNLEQSIECEAVLTPREIAERTSSHRGSLYGISSNSKTAAFWRQRNRSAAYQGLYFTGGSAHPGGGIPLVLLSGKIAAELLARYGTA